MSKSQFVPPPPISDRLQTPPVHPSQIPKEKQERIKAAVKGAQKIDTDRRKLGRKDFWHDNWIQILALVFSFIAALPVIIQGIQAIYEWLRSLN